MLYSLINDKGKLILTTPNYTISMRILEKLLNILGQVNYKNQHINRFNTSTFVDSIFIKLFPNKFGFILLASLKK